MELSQYKEGFLNLQNREYRATINSLKNNEENTVFDLQAIGF
jgi:hypothetical protein